MAGCTLNSITICIFILCSAINLSLEAVYPYYKAVRQTLTKLDLKTIEGKWDCLYQRRPKDQYGFCSRLDIIADKNYVNVTQSNGNETISEWKLVQNKYLEGKISQIVWLGSYSIEKPWFVIQTKPTLVVYQVISTNKSEDNWSIYGRQTYVDNKSAGFGIDKLIDAGIFADERGELGYHCFDQREELEVQTESHCSD